MPESITLFVPLSGRTMFWPAMAEFISTVPADARVVICDTSQSKSFNALVAKDKKKHWNIYRQTVGPQGLADWPRNPVRHLVQQAMCDIYQRLSDELATDLCLIVEDDVFPSQSFPELVASLGEGLHDESVGSVTALYRSRFFADYVAWESVNRISGVVKPLSEDFLTDGQPFGAIGGSGFGCLLIRQRVLSEECDRPSRMTPEGRGGVCFSQRARAQTSNSPQNAATFKFATPPGF